MLLEFPYVKYILLRVDIDLVACHIGGDFVRAQTQEFFLESHLLKILQNDL